MNTNQKLFLSGNFEGQKTLEWCIPSPKKKKKSYGQLKIKYPTTQLLELKEKKLSASLHGTRRLNASFQMREAVRVLASYYVYKPQ